MPSGGRAAVYAADMRGAVSLQLYPDGYEWVEPRPLPISYGYASHRVRAGACALPQCHAKRQHDAMVILSRPPAQAYMPVWRFALPKP